MDIKDPIIHKIIDFWKTIVPDKDKYLEQFEIPKYLYYRSFRKRCHFMVYFVCFLNAQFKSVVSFTIRKKFVERMFYLTRYINLANEMLFRNKGYKLRFVFQLKKMT